MFIKQTDKEYCATVIKVINIQNIWNTNFLKIARILNKDVIVSADIKVADLGLYFPVGTRLSKEFLEINNLYRKNKLNNDKAVSFTFDQNGKVQKRKFCGNVSQGFFIKISSLNGFVLPEQLVQLTPGTKFNYINGIKICEKFKPLKKESNVKRKPLTFLQRLLNPIIKWLN